mmetsp:Transcript_40281/g.86464  ORF Transcript_40281/g.86464 Transcript_40281/m.86464 type:complete len:482 (+) Transcript_40281:180-1625(+)
MPTFHKMGSGQLLLLLLPQLLPTPVSAANLAFIDRGHALSVGDGEKPQRGRLMRSAAIQPLSQGSDPDNDDGAAAAETDAPWSSFLDMDTDMFNQEGAQVLLLDSRIEAKAIFMEALPEAAWSLLSEDEVDEEDAGTDDENEEEDGGGGEGEAEEKEGDSHEHEEEDEQGSDQVEVDAGTDERQLNRTTSGDAVGSYEDSHQDMDLAANLLEGRRRKRKKKKKKKKKRGVWKFVKKFGPFVMLGGRDMESYCKDGVRGLSCDGMRLGRRREHFWIFQNLGAGWEGWSALQGGGKKQFCRVEPINFLNPGDGGKIKCDIHRFQMLDNLGKFRFDKVSLNKTDAKNQTRVWQCLRNKGVGGYCTNEVDHIQCSAAIHGHAEADYFAQEMHRAKTTTTTTTTTVTFEIEIKMPVYNETEAQFDGSNVSNDSQIEPAAETLTTPWPKMAIHDGTMHDAAEARASGETYVPPADADGAPAQVGGYR